MKEFIAALVANDSTTTAYSPRQVKAAAEAVGVNLNEAYAFMKTFPKIGRGQYDMASVIENVVNLPTAAQAVVPATVINPVIEVKAAVKSFFNEEVYVPARDKCYVSWGNSRDIETIIKSKAFYPTYISGLSGNGKTMMIEQACAKLGREYVRVQITPETDEDDLLGGFRLINGETVFVEGPVVKAMKAGALLTIDEIDRGSNKIMCLQGVLEGKPVLLKKTGQVVIPKEGFNVIATANTKGRGSEDGRFIAATIIDEAFLERFTITIEQEYPAAAVERKILIKHMEKFDKVDENFADLLVSWSKTIRSTYEDGGIDELISTRRLCHIAQTYSIFGRREKAVALCINRFDEDVKEAFLDLYTKVDASIAEERKAAELAEATKSGNDVLDDILKNI